MSMHTPAQDKARKKNLEKGLSREQAMKKFPWRKSMGDCRGFKYSPTTGIAIWT